MRRERVRPVDAIIDEAFAFNNITGVRTELNHIVFWFADPMMMKIAYLARLPDTSTETISPESRRCLRRTFSLARHSRNTCSAIPNKRVEWDAP